MEIVAFYVGLNALLMLVLSYLVGSSRGRQGALEPGATGDASLTRAIRMHGNYAEYVGLALIILLMLALLGYNEIWLHGIGAGFTLGRVSHAYGMMREKHPNAPRFLGNATTGLTLLIGGLACITPLLGVG
jgi:uncharacterized protein